MKEVFYLASPFSDPVARTRHKRFKAACLCCVALFKEGHYVFSPIAHSYPIALIGQIGHDFGLWRGYDLEMISRCDALMVLTIDGWDRSIGVRAEMDEAARLGKPIYYVDQDGRFLNKPDKGGSQ